MLGPCMNIPVPNLHDSEARKQIAYDHHARKHVMETTLKYVRDIPLVSRWIRSQNQITCGNIWQGCVRWQADYHHVGNPPANPNDIKRAECQSNKYHIHFIAALSFSLCPINHPVSADKYISRWLSFSTTSAYFYLLYAILVRFWDASIPRKSSHICDTCISACLVPLPDTFCSPLGCYRAAVCSISRRESRVLRGARYIANSLLKNQSNSSSWVSTASNIVRFGPLRRRFSIGNFSRWRLRF